MTDIQEELFRLRDADYAAFQAKLTPTVAADLFIGVRIPQLRQFAKLHAGEERYKAFLTELPHKYFDENILHALLICRIGDYNECIAAVEAFLPYIDNWAVCDILSPKCFKDRREDLLRYICGWSVSDRPYTCRFGMEMLMTWFLDEAFRPELLEIPAAVRSNEYYVNMMTAWFFATALAKQWNAAVPYLENRRLDRWTHNKTIQKSIESYRITEKHKEYLRSLKIK